MGLQLYGGLSKRARMGTTNNKKNDTSFVVVIKLFVMKHTHITGLEVGFLGSDQERCISNGRVSVLHLLILLFVFVLREEIIHAMHWKQKYIEIQTLLRYCIYVIWR